MRPLEQITLLGANNIKPNVFNAETFRSRNTDGIIFDEWSFDAAGLTDPIEKSRLVWAMLNAFGLINDFNIDLNILCEFITQIRGKYSTHNNTFHNFDHGITGNKIFLGGF